MILVQNDQKVGQIDATIKVNSVEEATKTDADGKMTLAKEYEVGTSISIEASKTGFAAKLDFMVEDNNGQDNLVTIELGYKKLESCSTDGENSVAKYLIKPGVEMAEASICEAACTGNLACEYYFFTSGKCYCGDLDGASIVPAPASLTGNVDVYLKDESKLTIAPFNSCFKKLEGCSTEGDNSFAKFLLKPGFQMPEANCKTACANNPACDYYFHKTVILFGNPIGTCYCGDLDGENPQSIFLTGTIDVYLKDASKATNEAFNTCS